MTGSPMVTIALVVRNEENRISDCLQHLLAQDIFESIDRDQIEFLIVDNGSLDRTIQIARRLLQSASVRFNILHSPENNMGLGRGIAVAESRAEFIGFVDADCWVPKAWLRRLLDEFAVEHEFHSPLAAVGTSNVPTQNHRWGKALYGLTQSFLGHLNSSQGKCASIDQSVKHLSTCAVVYKRSLILTVGNFSSDHSRVCEDVDMSCRLISAGFELRMLSGLEVEHHHSPDWRDWFNKIFLYGSGQPKMFFRYPVYRHWRFLLPWTFPWFWVAAALLSIFYSHWIFPLAVLGYVFGLLVVAHKGPRDSRVPLAQTLWAFLVTHFAYALGMLMGTWRLTLDSLFAEGTHHE